MQLTGANKKAVVPHVGTWIEMPARCRSVARAHVVPHVGTWIEMPKPVIVKIGNGGRASRRHVD